MIAFFVGRLAPRAVGRHVPKALPAVVPAALPVVLRAVVSVVVLLGLVLATLVLPPITGAASPTPTRPASTDTRSPLEGPGFVGAPAAALAAVLAIAVLALVVTTIYVRVTSEPGEPPPRE